MKLRLVDLLTQVYDPMQFYLSTIDSPPVLGTSVEGGFVIMLILPSNDNAKCSFCVLLQVNEISLTVNEFH